MADGGVRPLRAALREAVPRPAAFDSGGRAAHSSDTLLRVGGRAREMSRIFYRAERPDMPSRPPSDTPRQCGPRGSRSAWLRPIVRPLLERRRKPCPARLPLEKAPSAVDRAAQTRPGWSCGHFTPVGCPCPLPRQQRAFSSSCWCSRRWLGEVARVTSGRQGRRLLGWRPAPRWHCGWGHARGTKSPSCDPSHRTSPKSFSVQWCSVPPP